MSTMNEETPPAEETVAQAEEVVEKRVVPEDDPFTLEKGKERAHEAVDRVKQAGKTVTTQPFLDAIGSFFNRAVDGLIGLAEGVEGKAKNKRGSD